MGTCRYLVAFELVSETATVPSAWQRAASSLSQALASACPTLKYASDGEWVADDGCCGGEEY